MPVSESPREADFEQARSSLSKGLKACRAVVRNYRALMADDLGGNGGCPRNDRRPFSANDPD